MKVYYDLDKINLNNEKSAIALGYFDGLHLGHRQVINNILGEELSICFTFSKNDLEKRILTDDEKVKQLEELGVDVVLMPPFENLKNISANEFISILVEKLNVSKISCGFNYLFGKNALGNVKLLKDICLPLNIDVVEIEAMKVDNEVISSTAIKSYLSNGNILMANKMLGVNYSINSSVVNGFHLGRKLGFPTINQYPIGKVLPKYALYASNTYLDGKVYKSLTNIGVKPTIVGNREPLWETHILGIDQDLYGRNIKVELVDYIRDEAKFNNLEELVKAVNKDIEYYN